MNRCFVLLHQHPHMSPYNDSPLYKPGSCLHFVHSPSPSLFPTASSPLPSACSLLPATTVYSVMLLSNVTNSEYHCNTSRFSHTHAICPRTCALLAKRCCCLEQCPTILVSISPFAFFDLFNSDSAFAQKPRRPPARQSCKHIQMQ
jgi:hypothetical protein